MIKLNKSGVEYIDSTHEYFYEGRKLQGITGLLHKYVFPNMYANVSENVLMNAAQRGTMIHEEVELLASIGITPKAKSVKAFKAMIDSQGYEIVDSEYVMRIGEDHASAADLVMHKIGAPEDEVEIWDIKTTYSVNKEYVRWQNTMYKYGLEKLNPNLKVTKICCMWLRDDEKRGTICKLIPLGEPRPMNDIIELFQCEKEGRLFNEESKTPSFVLEYEEALIDVQERLAILKQEEQSLKEKIFKDMENNKLSSYKSSCFTYSMIGASERISLDTKNFDADDEETYEKLLKKYKKVTQVKPSLTLRRIV